MALIEQFQKDGTDINDVKLSGMFGWTCVACCRC